MAPLSYDAVVTDNGTRGDTISNWLSSKPSEVSPGLASDSVTLPLILLPFEKDSGATAETGVGIGSTDSCDESVDVCAAGFRRGYTRSSLPVNDVRTVETDPRD